MGMGRAAASSLRVSADCKAVLELYVLKRTTEEKKC